MSNEAGLIVAMILIPTILCIVLSFFVFLGRGDIKIKLKKWFRGKKCYILVKELRKDGRIHKIMTTVDDNKIRLGSKDDERTYIYDIKKAGINEYGIAEAWISEVEGSQLNPYNPAEQDTISPKMMSKMLAISTVVGMMPKKPLQFFQGKLPWLLIGGAVLFVVLAVSGYGG